MHVTLFVIIQPVNSYNLHSFRMYDIKGFTVKETNIHTMRISMLAQ